MWESIKGCRSLRIGKKQNLKTNVNGHRSELKKSSIFKSYKEIKSFVFFFNNFMITCKNIDK